MSSDYIEITDEDGHHIVYKGRIQNSNGRECYLCGSRRHWTMDCPRKDVPAPQHQTDKSDK